MDTNYWLLYRVITEGVLTVFFMRDAVLSVFIMIDGLILKN